MRQDAGNDEKSERRRESGLSKTIFQPWLLNNNGLEPH